MQQQIPQQDQYVNQQTMAQPIMLCPVQYVQYESPMLMPQSQEQQIQQNQTVVFNVQNPPPWIQNRPQPQNQVVYVQQVPNNYQHYIHPNMMQNIYHPQFNYQLQQPMLAQDNRQFVQIPNLAPFNTVQSQITQQVQQQIKNEEPVEKMPLLTQMLSQKVTTNNGRPANNVNNVNTGVTNVNNIGATNINNAGANHIRLANVNNVNAPNNIIRPVTQNQQVQTDISANNKGRPRNGQPQVITINPMQQHQYVPVNQKSDVIINISRPVVPYMRPEVPQHIRSKIPSSISVKSVYKPILPRPMRPFDVTRAPQNYYYNTNFVNVPNPEMRQSMISTDNSQHNVNSQGEVHKKPAEFNNVPAIKKQPTSTNTSDVDRTIQKQTVDASVTANGKYDLIKIYNDTNDKKILESNTEKSTESVTQTEEKLIRNTVYTQARGLILNDKQIVHGQSPKRTIHDRLEEERVATHTYEDSIRSSNKYIKVEVTNTSTLQNNYITVNNSLTPSVRVSCDDQSSSNNLLVSSGNQKSEELTLAESNKTVSKNPESPKETPVTNTDLETRKTTGTDTDKENIVIEEAINKIDDSVNTLNKENMLNNGKPKAEEVKVLTHVLDGYIIQESNVAFPIQKPALEKEMIIDTAVQDTHNEHNKTDKRDPLTDNTIKAKPADLIPHSSLIYLNKGIETEEEMEFAVANKDDPFANIQKSAVQAWTTEELTTHLVKYNWNETAAKLGDEEIDGESLLLVNKEQLLAIGIPEQHADAISAFTSAR